MKKWAWGYIICMVAIALLHPLLCNERPILASVNGKWTMPILDDYPTYTKSISIFNAPIRYSYNYMDVAAARVEPLQMGSHGRHWLGTDHLGRDVLAGICRGAFVSLSIGLLSVLGAMILGLAIGLLMGFFGDTTIRLHIVQILVFGMMVLLLWYHLIYPIGNKVIWVIGDVSVGGVLIYLLHKLPMRRYGIPLDMLFTKLIELIKSIPALVWLISILALAAVQSYSLLVIVMVSLGWMTLARYVRADALSIKKHAFVQSAIASGQSIIQTALRHILPNVMPTVLSVSGLSMISFIILESTCSFLGIGLPPGEVTWGSLLSLGRAYTSMWWLSVFPGIVLFLLLLSINTLVDGYIRSKQ